MHRVYRHSIVFCGYCDTDTVYNWMTECTRAVLWRWRLSLRCLIPAITSFVTSSRSRKSQIPLRYSGRRPGLRPGRRPVQNWNLAYHALLASSELERASRSATSSLSGRMQTSCGESVCDQVRAISHVEIARTCLRQVGNQACNQFASWSQTI